MSKKQKKALAKFQARVSECRLCPMNLNSRAYLTALREEAADEIEMYETDTDAADIRALNRFVDAVECLDALLARRELDEKQFGKDKT